MGRRWTWGGIATLVGCALVLFVLLPRSGEREEAGPRSDDRADATPEPAAHDTVTLRGDPEGARGSPDIEAQDAAGDDRAVPGETVRLRGRVLDAETGASVVGAWVHYGPSTSAPSAKAISGPDGRYELSLPASASARVVVLGGGWYSVGFTAARKDGFDPYVVDPGRVGDADHDLLVEPAGVVRGHVRAPEGRPASLAKVALSMAFPWRPPVQGMELAESFAMPVAPDGSYRFAALVPGCYYMVHALAPRGLPVHGERYVAERGEHRVVDLEVLPARWIHVRVVDAESGRGLPDATASTHVPSFPGVGAPGRTGRTDADGRVTLGPVRTGPIDSVSSIVVRKQGWFSGKCAVEATGPTDDILATCALERGLPLRVRVLEPSGKPPRLAWLMLERKEDFDPNAEGGGVGTLADGGGFWPCLRAGTYTVGISERAYGPIVAYQDVEAGQEDVVIRLPRALLGPIVIRVVGPDGEPIPRYAAAVVRPGATETGDHTGPMELGPYDESGPTWVEVQAAWDEEGVLLPLAPASLGPLDPDAGEQVIRLVAGRRIAGRVVDGQGVGILGVGIRAWPLDRGPAQGIVLGSHGTASTDADGHFDVIGLAGIRYRLFVEGGPDHAPAPRPVVQAGRTDVEIRLDQGVSVDLCLVDDDSDPIAGAVVRVVEPRVLGEVGYGRTDSRGEVRLEGLSARARYELRVQPPSERRDLCPFVQQGWTVKDARVTVPAGGVIAGRVVNQDGQPMSGATVVAFTGAKSAPYAPTDGKGAFTLTQITPGPVWLLATHYGDDVITSAPLRAEAGATDLRLVLYERTQLVIRLKGWPADVPLEGLCVRDTACPDATCLGRAADRASVVVRGVTPDRTYTFHKTLRIDGAMWVAHAAELRGDAGSVEVVLRPSASIQGVVTGPPDAVLPVVRIDERGVEARALASGDGTFRIDGLPEGEWTLTATSTGEHRRYRGTARVRTGVDARIELRPESGE